MVLQLPEADCRSAFAALLACLRSPEHVLARSCALLVFRHVQKTGGSTLRNFFRKQEATGDWEFYRRDLRSVGALSARC